MIPVSLTIGGIYSYREKQTIDFQPLTNAGIFGIFGSVGSGKSTILEAISFALYGETERLNKRDDRAYNMMNLKSKELFIDFIFKTGADEQEYRFLVKGKRNNKNFEKVATLDRSAYKKVNEAWEPVEVEAIASILQLSYENFRRTIIIPQGKFQEFLELTDTERTRMMKELFHLQRFELYDNISVLEQKNNEQRIRLEERIQQTGLITAEEIAAKENESLLLQQQLKSNQLLIAEKKAAEQLFLQLKKLFVRIAEQKALLLSLQLQQPGMKLLEQRIKSYEYCLLHFKPLFDRRTELQKQQDDQVAMLSLQTKELQQIEKTLTEKEKQFPEIKNAFENRQQLKARSEELQKIIQLNELHAALQKVNLRLEKGNIFLQTTDAELLTLQQQKDSISIQVKELKESLPDFLLLSEIKSWFIHKNSFATTVQNTINEQQSISMKTNALSADKNALFTPVIKKILPGIIIDETSGELIGQFKIRLNEIAETLQSNENELQHLLLQQQLEEYATQIKPGEPCPLCGAIEHPQILSATEVKVSIKKINLEKEIAQKNIALLQKIIQELEIIRSREASTAEQLAALQQRLKKEKSLLKKHDDKFIWTSWQKEDEQELNKQFSLADQQKKSIAKAEAAFEKIETQRKEKETQKETGRTTLENLKNESSALQAQVSLLQEQFKLLNADEYTEAETKNINQEILQLKNAYDKAEENFRSLE
ncbi:MAG: AAA family ATPase, partial [Chitinophagales bacterium]